MTRRLRHRTIRRHAPAATRAAAPPLMGPGRGAAVALAAVLSAAPALAEQAAEAPATTAKPAEPFRYDSGGRRDPFVPLVREGRLVATTQGARIEVSVPTLYGILWDPQGGSIALIDDAEVRVGETIAGFLVKAIQRDAVVLDNGGETVVLRITFDAGPARSSPGTTTGGEGP